ARRRTNLSSKGGCKERRTSSSRSVPLLLNVRGVILLAGASVFQATRLEFGGRSELTLASSLKACKIVERRASADTGILTPTVSLPVSKMFMLLRRQKATPSSPYVRLRSTHQIAVTRPAMSVPFFWAAFCKAEVNRHDRHNLRLCARSLPFEG